MDETSDGVQQSTDAELVEAFKSGKEWAFNELVRRFSNKVVTLCGYFLKDQDQANDAAQEVFLKVYRALGEFRGQAKLSTWIHTIAVNTCKNRLSFWKRLVQWQKRYDDDPLTKHHHEGPEEEAFRQERARIVRAAIAGLPLIHREIIVLKDIQGCCYEDIGEVLGLTAGTVKSRLHRAREALGQVLERTLGQDGW